MTAGETLEALETTIADSIAVVRDDDSAFARGMVAAFEIMQDSVARFKRITVV
jgi:hypothetical protein